MQRHKIKEELKTDGLHSCLKMEQAQRPKTMLLMKMMNLTH